MSNLGAGATPLRSPQPDVGIDKEAVKRAFLDKLFSNQGKFPKLATLNDYYMALAYTVRDMMLRRWVSTAATYTAQRARTVCYLSAEYLLGPHLGNNLINLGIYDQVRDAIEELGLDFELLLEQEPEPGLGNGGLGRLAAEREVEALLAQMPPEAATPTLAEPPASRKKNGTATVKKMKLK